MKMEFNRQRILIEAQTPAEEQILAGLLGGNFNDRLMEFLGMRAFGTGASQAPPIAPKKE